MSLEYSIAPWLLTEHHLGFLSLKCGYTGSSESTLVKMPHCRGSFGLVPDLCTLTYFKHIYSYFHLNINISIYILQDYHDGIQNKSNYLSESVSQKTFVAHLFLGAQNDHLRGIVVLGTHDIYFS